MELSTVITNLCRQNRDVGRQDMLQQVNYVRALMLGGRFRNNRVFVNGKDPIVIPDSTEYDVSNYAKYEYPLIFGSPVIIEDSADPQVFKANILSSLEDTFNALEFVYIKYDNEWYQFEILDVVSGAPSYILIENLSDVDLPVEDYGLYDRNVVYSLFDVTYIGRVYNEVGERINVPTNGSVMHLSEESVGKELSVTCYEGVKELKTESGPLLIRDEHLHILMMGVNYWLEAQQHGLYENFVFWKDEYLKKFKFANTNYQWTGGINGSKKKATPYS